MLNYDKINGTVQGWRERSKLGVPLHSSCVDSRFSAVFLAIALPSFGNAARIHRNFERSTEAGAVLSLVAGSGSPKPLDPPVGYLSSKCPSILSGDRWIFTSDNS